MLLHEQGPTLRPRRAVARSLAAVLAASVAVPVHAQGTNFCTEAGGQIELGFAVKPSLVAHSDAIMDTTFADAGLSGGDPTERLFSLKHTIGAILESAPAPNTPASREAFLQTMLDTFQRTPALMLNREAGVLIRDSPDDRLPSADNLPFRRSRQACEGSNLPRRPHRPTS